MNTIACRPVLGLKAAEVLARYAVTVEVVGTVILAPVFERHGSRKAVPMLESARGGIPANQTCSRKMVRDELLYSRKQEFIDIGFAPGGYA